MTPYFLFIVINILTLLLIISNKSLYLVSCFCILFFLILLIIKKNNNFFSKKLLFLFVPSAFVFGSGIFFDESDKWHYPGLKLLIILLLQNYFCSIVNSDELYKIFYKIFYYIPINFKKKIALCDIANISYTAIHNIMFKNKVNFVFKGNFIDSIVEYLVKIEREITNVLNNTDIKSVDIGELPGLSKIQILILFIIIAGWWYIEYFMRSFL